MPWTRYFGIVGVFTICTLSLFNTRGEAQVPALLETRIVSTVDAVEQPIRYWTPTFEKDRKYPLLVSLHSWSADYAQDRSEWVREAMQRDWIYLQPNFRGVNQSPDACGSMRARWDILDAIDWAIREFPVDESRIYLCGVSGGGHMTMLMAGYHPERFSAASAWVGISDLESWYRFHARDGIEVRYAQMISASCGGKPDASAAVAVEYMRRSPIYFLQNARDLPLDLNTGIRDGKEGSVPIDHTLNAYNAVVRGQHPLGNAFLVPGMVSQQEIQQLLTNDKLDAPKPEDTTGDETYSRRVLMRRHSGKARVTVFDGGHEALPPAACLWLEQQVRATRKPVSERIP